MNVWVGDGWIPLRHSCLKRLQQQHKFSGSERVNKTILYQQRWKSFFQGITHNRRKASNAEEIAKATYNQKGKQKTKEQKGSGSHLLGPVYFPAVSSRAADIFRPSNHAQVFWFVVLVVSLSASTFRECSGGFSRSVPRHCIVCVLFTLAWACINALF